MSRGKAQMSIGHYALYKVQKRICGKQGNRPQLVKKNYSFHELYNSRHDYKAADAYQEGSIIELHNYERSHK